MTTRRFGSSASWQSSDSIVGESFGGTEEMFSHNSLRAREGAVQQTVASGGPVCGAAIGWLVSESRPGRPPSIRMTAKRCAAQGARSFSQHVVARWNRVQQDGWPARCGEYRRHHC